jgi:oligopeptide/dipeptide ABC transporter ATP-binding protein
MITAAGLVKDFKVSLGLFQGKALLRAVDHISLEIAEGETVALVGESGSGKSTLGRMLLGLITPTAGTLQYQGVDLADLKGAAWRSYRSEVQAVFQDTSASLNPRRTIEDSVSAPLIYNHHHSDRQARLEATRIMERVGLDPNIFSRRYPHQLSGGQRQRVGLARALASRPRLLVADEPVSALDVSVRAQILKLMIELQQQEQLAMLFITHDLGVARWIARRVIVMYLGASVEEGATEDVFAHPFHPYTQALLTAAPVPDPERPRVLRNLKGDIPSPLTPPSGCRFHPRCPIAQAICAEQPPKTVIVHDRHGDHQAACHFVNPSQEI